MINTDCDPNNNFTNLHTKLHMYIYEFCTTEHSATMKPINTLPK